MTVTTTVKAHPGPAWLDIVHWGQLRLLLPLPLKPRRRNRPLLQSLCQIHVRAPGFHR